MKEEKPYSYTDADNCDRVEHTDNWFVRVIQVDSVLKIQDLAFILLN